MEVTIIVLVGGIIPLLIYFDRCRRADTNKLGTEVKDEIAKSDARNERQFAQVRGEISEVRGEVSKIGTVLLDLTKAVGRIEGRLQGRLEGRLEGHSGPQAPAQPQAVAAEPEAPGEPTAAGAPETAGESQAAAEPQAATG